MHGAANEHVVHRSRTVGFPRIAARPRAGAEHRITRRPVAAIGLPTMSAGRPDRRRSRTCN
jgi:hypothetical protein